MTREVKNSSLLPESHIPHRPSLPISKYPEESFHLSIRALIDYRIDVYQLGQIFHLLNIDESKSITLERTRFVYHNFVYTDRCRRVTHSKYLLMIICALTKSIYLSSI